MDGVANIFLVSCSEYLHAQGRWVPIEHPPHASSGLTATLLVGETLTILINGRYAPGRHHVFVPSVASSLSSADDSWYQYSLMFVLHPH